MSKINTPRLIQTIAIGFILVLCPAASWYYLQKGLDYQKESRKELAEIESIHTGDLIPEYIKIDSTLLDKKLRVLIFNGDNDQTEIDKITTKLHDQFESSDGFFMIEFIVDNNNSDVERSVDKNNIHIVKMVNRKKYDHIQTSVLGVPVYIDKNGHTALDKLDKSANADAVSDKVYAYLIDQNDKVRNVYDLLDKDRVKRMVEHTAILIPKLDKEEVKLKRENEL